jgi:hypothetical protein
MAEKIKWNLPMALPGGELLPHMSARRRTEIVDTVFEGIGGVERLAAYASRNDENYGNFIKIWAKGQAKASSVEVHGSEGVENMLKRLDERDRRRQLEIVDTTCEEVTG